MRIEVAKLSVHNTTNDIKSIPLESKDIGGSLFHRQSISQNKKAHWAKTYKGGLRKLGHPADCNLENRNSQAKVRDNKSKERGHYKSSTTWKMLQKKKGDNECLPNSTGEPFPKESFQTRIEFDAQLTEARIEGHHEERVGTNILWAFILCFLNREPSHVTTLQKS